MLQQQRSAQLLWHSYAAGCQATGVQHRRACACALAKLRAHAAVGGLQVWASV
jgi:hypothetical protein